MTDTVTPLFTALNVSTLATNITTLLTAGVGVTLLFVAYKFVKRGARAF
jgi:hypothetical protein